MKLAMVAFGDDAPRLGVVQGLRVLDVGAVSDNGPWASSLYALIEAGPPAMEQLKKIVSDAPEGAWHPVESVGFRAPIPRPPKNVFCVGKNYNDHIHEGARVWGDADERPLAPVIFTKPHTAIIGPGEPIRMPSNTRELDYEGELGVIIGRGGRGIQPQDVGAHVFGYMLVNDVTARDLQQRGSQWFLGKACDTFFPTGPWVVVADPDMPQPDLEIRVLVNGKLRQHFVTGDMIFDIPAIVAELSRNITLEPGDIIATGTGPGGGFAHSPPKFLQPGDTVTVEAPGLGSLSNKVV